tara:strand:+ start:106 stop:483 length:378 start_codon:yes stop_codon:yes gene_type:complete
MVDKIKTAIKEATTNPFIPTTSSGGVSINTKLTLGADATSEYLNCPKQVQLLCNYLHEFGGTATLQQLNEFATKAEGIQFWGRGGKAYNQTVSKITAHYFPRLLGSAEWELVRLGGKAEIVRIVK